MTSVRPQVKVGVGLIIHRDDEVLLIRRSASHGSGTWSTPGGHIDPGESLEECAAREALEETGVEVANVHFRAVTNDVFEDEGKHYLTVWMEADYRSGEASVAADYELTEVGWFPWDDLPEPLFLPLRNLLGGRCHGKSRHTGTAPRFPPRFRRKWDDGAPTRTPGMGSFPTIRSFRESDRTQLEALWARVFPDDPPRNAPARIIEKKLKVQPELLLVATDAEGHEGSEGLVGAVMAGFDGTRGWIHQSGRPSGASPERHRDGPGSGRGGRPPGAGLPEGESPDPGVERGGSGLLPEPRIRGRGPDQHGAGAVTAPGIPAPIP